MTLDAHRPVAAIFDVDGTLCDVRSVRKYVEATPGPSTTRFRRDFARFHRESLGCPPHHHVVGLVHNLRADGVAILIVSGREERWTALTEQWLRTWSIQWDGLYLRPAKDYRPDVEVKTEIGERIVREYAPLVAVDDRDDIMQVWRRFCIPTIKVSEDGALVGSMTEGR